jgi:hypothetical protein
MVEKQGKVSPDQSLELPMRVLPSPFGKEEDTLKRKPGFFLIPQTEQLVQYLKIN